MTDARFATVSTKLSADEVHIQHLEGTEELGRPFEFEVELLCEKHDLKLDDQLGQPLTVAIEARDNEKRYFSGIVSQMSFTGYRGHLARYVAVMRPWIWFLTYSSDNRIFQNKKVPDILAEVFKAHGQSARKSLSGTYREREYCAQYGESDFDFVSRLMEEEGIYYFFEHSDGKHELVLADSPSAHKAFGGYEKVSYFPPEEHHSRTQDHIDHWELMHQVETQEVALDSYNYETPKTDLEAKSKIKQEHGWAEKQNYEYGQLYPVAADGTSISKVRVEEQQAAFEVGTGGGDVMGICSGCTFELEGFPRDDQNAKYLVIGANFQLENNNPETGAEAQEASFNCFFRAIPEATPFRPARVTGKAIVRGPQTAVVVGPAGDEIYTDKYGRVKVQFHWDRDGKNDDKSSCWIRVSTAVAGQNWGMIVIPRIGQEVIVDFLEGDPDQPIIVGSVYNEDNMPPYSLPDNQTQSGILTRSTKKGTPKNFNELRFEDKKGEEEVFFHSEKNFKRVVKNNDRLEVGLVTKDKGDQEIEIHNDRTVTLKEGDDTLTVEKGSQKVDVKKKINIVAGDELKIKVGQSELTMKKNGDVTIKGMKLLYQASNSVTIKGTAKVEIKGAQVKITGDAKTDVKGAMTTVEGSGILDLKGGAMAKLKGGITMIG